MNESIIKKYAYRHVLILLTHSCNLNCIYCYEGKKGNGRISFDTIKAILDKELSLCQDGGKLRIHFFGGEPFLAFDLIKNAVSYLKTLQIPVQLELYATTNGTILNEEIKAWLIQNRDIFHCQLSVDGTREMHDHNRSGSFSKIDFEFFESIYSPLTVRMTVPLEDLSQMYEGITYLHSRGYNVYCSLEKNGNWDDQSQLHILESQLDLLVAYYLARPSIKPCTLFRLPLNKLVHPYQEGYLEKWCGAGTQMCAYDIDGTPFPCQMFTPMATSSLPLEPYFEDIPLEKINSNCRNCRLIKICPSCMGENYQTTGHLYWRTGSKCPFNKALIRANARYQLGRIKAGLTSKKEALTLVQALQLIQTVIDIDEGN